MPPRKSINIDDELAALQAKAEKLRIDQKLMLGELVIETGIHKVLNADQLRDALIRLRDQGNEAWLMQGGERSDSGVSFSAPPERSHTGPKRVGRAEPEPVRHRPPDLLADAAPDRAGHRPPAEEPGLDRAS